MDSIKYDQHLKITKALKQKLDERTKESLQRKEQIEKLVHYSLELEALLDEHDIIYEKY